MQLSDGDTEAVYKETDRVQGRGLVVEVEIWVLFGKWEDWRGAGVSLGERGGSVCEYSDKDEVGWDSE